LIDVARQLFAKNGLEGTTMNDIAVASNRGRRTLYTYFKSKEDIYLAVIETELDRLFSKLEEVAKKNIPPEDKIVQLIFAHLEVIKEVVLRNGTLRAEFFREIWKVETVRKNFDRNIAVLKLFPGITPNAVDAILHTKDLHGVIIETFGSGNAPTEPWFIHALEDAIKRDIIILDVTQCKAGSVILDQYEASCDLSRIGVIGGNDITLEAAVTKMMYLLGTYPNDHDHVRRSLTYSLRGEMTIPNENPHN
jgi:AcrR family transcriptional regulator